MAEPSPTDTPLGVVELDRQRIARRLRELASSIEQQGEAVLVEQARTYLQGQSNGYGRWGVAKAYQLVVRPEARPSAA